MGIHWFTGCLFIMVMYLLPSLRCGVCMRQSSFQVDRLTVSQNKKGGADFKLSVAGRKKGGRWKKIIGAI